MPGHKRRIDIFEQMRLEIAEQAQAMTTYARPFAGGVVAEAVFAKNIVLGARNVGGSRAGPHCRDACFKRLAKNRKCPLLCIVRLSHHQRAADLDEIAADRGCELGGDEIARTDAPFRCGRHAQHILAARSNDHEIIRAAAASQIGLDLRNDFVLRTAGPHRRAKYPIGIIGHARRAPYRVDFRWQLVHEQPVENGGSVLEVCPMLEQRIR